jgi:hypothetical protein
VGSTIKPKFRSVPVYECSQVGVVAQQGKDDRYKSIKSEGLDKPDSEANPSAQEEAL